MVIIISSRDDAHIPFVARHLHHTPYIVIDGFELINSGVLTFSITQNQFEVMYKHRRLTDITGVWVRRPALLGGLEVPVEERFLPYVHSSLKNHLKQLFAAFPTACWVSDEYAIQRASTKTLQLRLASEIGLAIPETLFTSDRIAAQEFTRTHQECIVKSQSVIAPRDNKGRAQAYFATRVSASTALGYEGLDLAPSIFQQLIEPAFDLRVTVVGETVFAAKITLTGIPAHRPQRDWRLGHVEGALAIEAYEIPAHIANQCSELVKKLHLNFGAIDLIQDRTGKIWFLEINPNGQWAFVEEATGQPIGKHLAALLSGQDV